MPDAADHPSVSIKKAYKFNVPSWLMPALLILLGFVLRLIQVGRASFWYDEVGQVIAANQHSLQGMFDMIRGHAMAMPLDYIVTRIMSLLGSNEALLRLPSVIWSTLSLVMLYLLAKQLADREAALVALLLAVIWPVNIHYAQEVRFYAALGFFYLLSNLLLFLFLDTRRRKWWILFIIFGVVGAYFHPYVLLAGINGFFAWLVSPKYRQNKSHFVLLSLVAAGLIQLALFWPGFVYFGEQDKFSFPLFGYESLMLAMGRGFGWLAFPYSSGSTPFGIYEFFIVFLGMMALVTVLRKRSERFNLLGYSLGTGIQVGVILLADWFKGYWFLYRQIIHLAPLTFILLGTSVVEIVGYVKLRFPGSKLSRTAWIGIFAMLVAILQIPSVVNFYSWEKANGDQIVRFISETRPTPDKICVIPAYEKKVYEYYFQKIDRSTYLPLLAGCEWLDLTSKINDNVFVITPAVLTDEERKSLEDAGLVLRLSPKHPWITNNVVWGPPASP